MAITQESHWDNVGTEPGAGDAEYAAGDQPIAEYDNWFNWSAAKDVENLIAALENVTTGHDHDGANSKQVDGSDVVNTPAGTIVATDVQAALNELDGDITNHVGDASDAHDASAISNVPAGSISATNVQDAINELDTEKLSKALFDTNTIIKSDSDDTPAALTVVEQTLVGRITSGVITALTVTQVRTLLNVGDGADATPTGVIFPFGGVAAPSGYLLCDGAAVSRTTYSGLFAVVGTVFGVGDGSTTFNLPDTQGKVPVGIGASGVAALGDVGGEQEHTLSEAEMPDHDHSVNMQGAGAYNFEIGGYTHQTVAGNTGSKGGGAAHNNMQPYLGTEYIIKI